MRLQPQETHKMMILRLFLFFILFLVHCSLFDSNAQNSPRDPFVPDDIVLNPEANFPATVQNIQTVIDQENKRLIIEYELLDSEDDDIEIGIILVSSEGNELPISENFLSGDIGFPLKQGMKKKAIWSFENDPVYSSIQNKPIHLKIIADDKYSDQLTDLVDLVSAERISKDILEIQGVRHHNSNPERLESTRTYIKASFSAYGVPYFEQKFSNTRGTGINIIGSKPGMLSERFYIIDGHYDTVSSTPGADDNATGTVGMLEAMRVLSQFNFDYGIEFIGFDMEELGLLGSRNYAQSITHPENVNGVFNFEMIGFTCKGEPNCRDFPNADSSIYNIYSSFSDSLSNAFVRNGNNYVPGLKITPVKDNGDPNFRRSDHAPFWDKGIDALFLTDGANFRTPHYHRSTDLYETLDIEFMTKIVQTTVATIADLANVTHTSATISNSLIIE